MRCGIGAANEDMTRRAFGQSFDSSAARVRPTKFQSMFYSFSIGVSKKNHLRF
jgi:hypothetical protein